MTVKTQKRTRKNSKAKITILLILALLVGFVAGAIFAVNFLQNYTIVLSKSDNTQKPLVSDVEQIVSVVEETEARKETEEYVPESVPEKRKKIAIDAGHQQKGNFSKEPIAPGASETKAKVAGGTTGIVTKIPEYRVTLEVSLLLEEELITRGYDVIMIRRTNDVDISNSQRAMMANDAEADAFIRIHCNGVENSSVQGALTMCQTPNNKYCGDLYSLSRSLSEMVLDGLCQQTGARNCGVSETDTMSGINWCRVPVTIVEMGYMTNPEEDQKMATESYQQLIAIGIADGIDAYLQ